MGEKEESLDEHILEKKRGRDKKITVFCVTLTTHGCNRIYVRILFLPPQAVV